MKVSKWERAGLFISNPDHHLQPQHTKRFDDQSSGRFFICFEKKQNFIKNYKLDKLYKV